MKLKTFFSAALVFSSATAFANTKGGEGVGGRNRFGKAGALTAQTLVNRVKADLRNPESQVAQIAAIDGTLKMAGAITSVNANLLYAGCDAELGDCDSQFLIVVQHHNTSADLEYDDSLSLMASCNGQGRASDKCIFKLLKLK